MDYLGALTKGPLWWREHTPPAFPAARFYRSIRPWDRQGVFSAGGAGSLGLSHGARLGNYQFDKLFSLNEASELIPTLELLVRELQGCVKSLRTRLAALHGGDPALERMLL